MMNHHFHEKFLYLIKNEKATSMVLGLSMKLYGQEVHMIMENSQAHSMIF